MKACSGQASPSTRWGDSEQERGLGRTVVTSRLVPLLRVANSHTVGVGKVLARQLIGESVVMFACSTAR